MIDTLGVVAQVFRLMVRCLRKTDDGSHLHQSSNPCFSIGLATLLLAAGCSGEPARKSGPPSSGPLETSRQHLDRLVADNESRFVLSDANRPLPVRVDADTRLRIGFGMTFDAWGNQPEEIEFRASFVSPQTNQVLLEHRVPTTADPSAVGWHDSDLSLAAFSGQTGNIKLEIRTPSGTLPAGGGIAWSNPRLENGRAAKGLNIVLISIDTLRADRLHCYGNARETSPNIDRLAREGARFRYAIAPSSWTLPSHASLFTSLNPSCHGAFRFGRSTPLSTDLDTLTELLWDAGYETAAFTGGGYVAARFGFDQGFDRYLQASLATQAKRNFGDHVDAALRWMSARQNRFFLFLHTYSVHMPYEPPTKDLALIVPDLPGARRSSFTYTDLFRFGDDANVDPETLRQVETLYDAEVRHMDEVIGKLFDSIRSGPLSANTCIIFTSDHGEEFKEHGNLFHRFPKLYEELIHIPLIFWCPSRIRPGRVVQEPVALIDVMPTILQLAGVDIPESLQGMSLMPHFEGHTSGNGRLLLSEVDGSIDKKKGTTRSLRSERFKLIVSSIDESQELFDLRDDPGEHLDASAQHPASVLRLASELRKMEADCPSGNRNRDAAKSLEADQAVREQLRALGYDVD